MDVASNVSDGEYDYNYDDSDVEVDDDNEYYDEVEDAAADENTNNYTILKEEDIRKRQDENITEVSTVLQISKEAACLVLRGYNWSVSEVFEEWYTDEEKVRKAVGIIVETPKEKFPGNMKIKCGICLEEVSCMNQTCAGCGHLYCNLCWKGYIRTSIKDGPGCLKLRCPEPSCVAGVGRDMIDKFASDEDKEKYNSFLLRSYVENSRKIKWCPAPGCDSAVELVVGSESYDVICGCSYGFCWNCKEEAHRPVDCETVGNWILKNCSEAENTSWIIANCKLCPKCKRSIEKNQGCMHMTCGGPCNFEFCWLCLGAWSEHNERTGGHYDCNRYEEAKITGVYDESERKREMAKKSLERYTHYYERWTSNNLSRQKALEDLDQMQTVHFEKLSDVQMKTEAELKFILEAWEQIVECRRVLKWSYAYGYYLREEEDKQKTELFEYLQGEAESGLERLHQCAEKELMKYIKLNEQSEDFIGFSVKLIDLTKVTRNYFENLVRALQNGLSD